MKFNWDSFKNEKIVVHCKTKEEAEEFCREMHEHGLKWYSNLSYLEETYWNGYKENTCYRGNGLFCNIHYYKENNYNIIEYSEIKEGENKTESTKVNFKAKCLDTGGCLFLYKKEKVYEIKNGIFTYEDGDKMTDIISFEDLCSRTSAIWEKVKDLRELIKPCYIVVRRDGSVCGIFETNKGVRLQTELGLSKCYLDDYNEDLLKGNFGIGDTDIMEVYGLSEYSFDISTRNRELIWKREETPIKSPTQIEIESIEAEQRKLADRLSELRKGL